MQGRGLDEKDVIGATALWWACHRGYAEVVMALLLAGADHTLVDSNGRTPRQIALDQKRVECVNCLEVRGIRVIVLY
jgi:ankyrin repeat protein